MARLVAMRDYLEDYRRGAEGAGGFFRQSWYAKGALGETAALVRGRRVQPVVLAELRRINGRRSARLDENIELLEKGEALVVATGQQLGFLGGPLHTLYKAATCIRAAKFAEEQTGIRTVPLFWLQSEDHDFEEIAEAKFFGVGESVNSFSLLPETCGTGDSVGPLKISSGSAARLPEFLSGLENSDRAFTDLLQRSYAGGNSLVQAFSELLSGIFSEHGLLLFDPAVKSVKELCRDFFASCFLRAGALNRLLELRCEELKADGYGIQVPVKKDSPLAFISHHGRRERLTEDASGRWHGSDYVLGKDELYQILAESPERFTSSALLRPLLQDSLFPVLSYVSGPAEFRYHAELKPLYPFLGCVQPLILPRAQFVVLEAAHERLLNKLGLQPEDVEASGAQFVAGLFSGGEFDSGRVFADLEYKVLSRVGALEDVFRRVDPGLQKALSVTQESLKVNLERLKLKYEKALERHESTRLAQFERLRNVFYPGEEPQERVICLSHYLLKYGRRFSETVLDAAWPLTQDKRKVLYMREDFDG